jgi:hypothetical protein
VFDETLCNNKKVPLYFLRKLWVELVLGQHVNYFDIGELQGLGHVSTQDRENFRHVTYF